jgi:TPR repeat protein
MGRASVAKHDYPSAKRQFESALSDGYRAAGVDLANLLTNPATDGVDPTRAAALYQRAWQDGVLIGAADLAHLYESGSPDKKPDAWVWYQKGADAGEPTAMARFAERDERDALIETDNAKRSALLLRAFSHYASACVRASEEAWPDPVWRSWRYRRASLARLLARQGMMEQVADRYRAILDKRR